MAAEMVSLAVEAAVAMATRSSCTSCSSVSMLSLVRVALVWRSAAEELRVRASERVEAAVVFAPVATCHHLVIVMTQWRCIYKDRLPFCLPIQSI